MSAEKAVTPPNLKPGQSFILGKIAFVKTLSGQRKGYSSRIVAPAADEYSMPKHYDVFSVNRLGHPEETVRIVVELEGWPRRGVSEKTGEHYDIAQLSLRAVE